MKILYILGQLALYGGEERVSAIKMNYLVDEGYDVTLCTYEQMGRPFVYHVSHKVKHYDLGINYNVEELGGSLYSARCLKMVPEHFRRTKELIEIIQPDIIVVPNFGYEFWFMPFIKGKSKIVREFHGSQYGRLVRPRWKDKLKYIADNISLKKYDAVVLLTPEEKEYFEYKENLYVIPNPTSSCNRKTDLANKRIISAGRIAAVKGFEMFIEIASKVVPLHPDYIFEVYGDGNANYLETLNKLVESRGIQNNFYFRGPCDDIPSKLASSLIYVCTSLTECFPLSLLEAHESGLPIVSFDCPNGPRNIINDGKDGVLISPYSTEDAANAICDLLNNPVKLHEMSKNAINNAERFHVPNIMRMWDKLFNELLKE